VRLSLVTLRIRPKKCVFKGGIIGPNPRWMKLARCRHLSISATLLLLTLFSQALGAEPDVTVPSWVRHLMLSQPRPEYPIKARTKHITGRGVFDVIVRTDSGAVTQVKILQSTGSKLLDDAAVKALSSWRARPGMINHIQVPVKLYDVISPPSNQSLQRL